MKLVSVRSGGTDVIVKVEWSRVEYRVVCRLQLQSYGSSNAADRREVQWKNSFNRCMVEDEVWELFVSVLCLPSGTLLRMHFFLATKEATKCVVACLSFIFGLKVEVDPKMTF